MLTLFINSLAVLRLQKTKQAPRKRTTRVRALPPMSDHLLRDIGLFDIGVDEESTWEERRREKAPEPPQQKRRS